MKPVMMKNAMVAKIKATSTKASKQHNDITGYRKDRRQNGGRLAKHSRQTRLDFKIAHRLQEIGGVGNARRKKAEVFGGQEKKKKANCRDEGFRRSSYVETKDLPCNQTLIEIFDENVEIIMKSFWMKCNLFRYTELRNYPMESEPLG